MDHSHKESPNSRHRRTGREEEQSLCDEALKSGDYDQLSDAAWIRLCEEAVTRGQQSNPAPSAEAL